MEREFEFCVSICFGNGDGGEVYIDETVTEEEYELLIQGCHEAEDIRDIDGLEDLYDRLVEAAIEIDEDNYDEDVDYDDASYIVYIPGAIYDEADDDLDEDEDFDEEEEE